MGLPGCMKGLRTLKPGTSWGQTRLKIGNIEITHRTKEDSYKRLTLGFVDTAVSTRSLLMGQ